MACHGDEPASPGYAESGWQGDPGGAQRAKPGWLRQSFAKTRPVVRGRFDWARFMMELFSNPYGKIFG